MKEYWTTTSTLDSLEDFENHLKIVYTQTDAE